MRNFIAKVFNTFLSKWFSAEKIAVSQISSAFLCLSELIESFLGSVVNLTNSNNSSRIIMSKKKPGALLFSRPYRHGSIYFQTKVYEKDSYHSLGLSPLVFPCCRRLHPQKRPFHDHLYGTDLCDYSEEVSHP